MMLHVELGSDQEQSPRSHLLALPGQLDVSSLQTSPLKAHIEKVLDIINLIQRAVISSHAVAACRLVEASRCIPP